MVNLKNLMVIFSLWIYDTFRSFYNSAALAAKILLESINTKKKGLPDERRTTKRKRGTK